MRLSRVDATACFVIFSILCVCVGCCGSKFDSIQTGMTEGELRLMLGEPDLERQVNGKSPLVFSDKTLINKFGYFKLLIYKCTLKRDLFVSIAPDGKVVKIERTTFIE